MVRDCKEIRKKPIKRDKRPTRPPQPHHIYQQERGKNVVVEHEGFQQVKIRNNTKRKIFEDVDDMLREQVYEQWEEAKSKDVLGYHGQKPTKT